MKEGSVIWDQTLPHFTTPKVVDWIDIFTRQIYRDIVVECLEYCIKNKGMILYGYAIMSNHLIVQSEDGKLSDLIRDLKNSLQKVYWSEYKIVRKAEENGCWNVLN